MLKKSIFVIVFICFIFSLSAQDSLSKRSDHYVGVQVNQLIKQIFNFSSSSSAINNPYLLTYAVNSVRTGWGANFGLGYTFNEFTDGDAFSQRKTKINELFFRTGFEKKSSFGKRWILSAGMDVLIDLKNNSTKTVQDNNAQLTFKTKTKSNGWGLGPRVTLNYDITGKLLVGTEVTYYFKSMKNTVVNSGGSISDEEITEKLKNFQFNVPTAIFMILKF